MRPGLTKADRIRTLLVSEGSYLSPNPSGDFDLESGRKISLGTYLFGFSSSIPLFFTSVWSKGTVALNPRGGRGAGRDAY